MPLQELFINSELTRKSLSFCSSSSHLNQSPVTVSRSWVNHKQQEQKQLISSKEGSDKAVNPKVERCQVTIDQERTTICWSVGRTRLNQEIKWNEHSRILYEERTIGERREFSVFRDRDALKLKDFDKDNAASPAILHCPPTQWLAK